MGIWAESIMSVVLPTDNADTFENMFLTDDKVKNAAKVKHFKKCFITDIQRESNNNELTRLVISFNAAVSMSSCFIDKSIHEDEEKCPTLEEICKELKVIRVVAKSQRPSANFEESILYDQERGINSFTHDLYLNPLLDVLYPEERLKQELEEYEKKMKDKSYAAVIKKNVADEFAQYKKTEIEKTSEEVFNDNHKNYFYEEINNYFYDVDGLENVCKTIYEDKGYVIGSLYEFYMDSAL